jgi:type VI secretion system secreted protein VgrG
MSLSQDNLNLSVSTPLGKDALVLQSLTGHEEVFGLFSFHLEMTGSSSSLSAASIVGKDAAVTLKTASGTTRYFHGKVARFVQGPTDEWGTTYWAELVPWAWFLTLASDCRIFQNKSVPDIITEVCSDLGFTDIKKSLKQSYTARDYCVQYRETAYAFICRLMAEEGIFFFFEYTDSSHTMVLGDDASAHSAISGLDSAEYSTPFGAESRWRGDVITSLSLTTSATTGKVAYDDYNFETPSTQLLVKVTGKGSTMQRYDYPGRFMTKDNGESYASLRMQAYELPGTSIAGESTIPLLTAGGVMTVTSHPRDDVNADWVLLAVEHQITQQGYRNSYQAFPKDTPYRPWPDIHKPLIAGTQTATVVGKSGEEIWTDKYGRIKVLFHWDQLGSADENASCWVRVAQGWAGKSWGAWVLPRIGQEVVVSFLEGDPDRPLVTGCVYNAEQTVPYGLPDEQTKTTLKSNSSKGGGGYNEFRFEDKKDSEEVYLQAQKDMNVLIKNQRETTVDKADDILTLNEGNQTTTVSKGNKTTTVSKGNRSTTVSEGNDTLEITQGTRSKTIGGNETYTNKGDFTQTVSGNYSLTIDGDLTITAKSITIESSSGAISITSATTTSVSAGTSASIDASTSLTTSAGTSATHSASTGMTLDGGLQLEGTGTTISMTGSATGTFDGGGVGNFKGAITNLG